MGISGLEDLEDSGFLGGREIGVSVAKRSTWEEEVWGMLPFISFISPKKLYLDLTLQIRIGV